MKLRIGDQEFDVPRVKTKMLRKYLELMDKAQEATVVEQLDLTLEFYVSLLGDQHPIVTKEWLEEHMDAYMCNVGYFNKVLLEVMGEPKNAEGPEAAA